MTRVVSALAAAFTLAACATAGQEAASGPWTGCYQFQWTADARALGVPWGFELTADTLEGWPNIPRGRKAVTRATATRTLDHPIAFWMPLEGDSIRVGHPGGGGFSFTLGRDGQDLAGWGRPVGDVVRPGEDFGARPAHPVTARRVLCPPAGGP